MPIAVNHAMLVAAFEYAIAESRKDMVHVVDNIIDWRNNFGQDKDRIETLYGAMTHHTGGDATSARVVSYVRSIATGSLRPDIGKVLSNTASVRSGVWPGSNDKPTIVVLAANYANHAGTGDQALLDELADGDIDLSDEFKPGDDDLYVNRFFLGDEGVGTYTDASQQRAFVIFYGHLLWKLGLTADRDRDGKFAPIVGHRESTDRKSDPSNADLAKMRISMQEFINERYNAGKPAPTDPYADRPPVGYSNPHVPLKIDGIWHKATSRALQHVLRYKYNAWGFGGPLTVDGTMGRNTYRALQHALNRQANAGLAEDGLFGPASRKALQRYIGATADGIIGPVSVRALQNKINKGF